MQFEVLGCYVDRRITCSGKLKFEWKVSGLGNDPHTFRRVADDASKAEIVLSSSKFKFVVIQQIYHIFFHDIEFSHL